MRKKKKKIKGAGGAVNGWQSIYLNWFDKVQKNTENDVSVFFINTTSTKIIIIIIATFHKEEVGIGNKVDLIGVKLKMANAKIVKKKKGGRGAGLHPSFSKM